MFQIASDLHIEKSELNDTFDTTKYIVPSARNLILAGDIGTFYKYGQLYNFISSLSTQFDTIIYVPGNHEYYRPRDKSYPRLSMHRIKNLAKSMMSKIRNLHILDNTTLRIGNFTVVGSTLWSDSSIETYIPKSLNNIVGLDLPTYREMYNSSVSFLTKEISRCSERGERVIVVTHYSPSPTTIPNLMKLNLKNIINFYASNVEYLFGDPVVCWISGHIHYNFDFTMSGTKLVSNQKGKLNDDVENFSLSCILDIE